ncbi:disease resistance protein TAO1-like [Mercurialis annua]|uniref:disease resistance protein TAO1-like n=1 Tax=Mercurialis annua TaxID=3986 RepID=UPI002160EDF7|nr:disease resistance protein TAO1-like [Mercurialis annua]XP_050224950.1 disease resistance protein TAO1-like [Mercurialis annua]
MHDLLQELGQDIVNRESRKEAGQRSRIWLYEDFNHILMNDTGSEQIEGVVLDLVDRGEGYLSSVKGFVKMKYVRVLILRYVQFLHDLEYLSNELKYLEWYEYPFKSPPSTFQPNKLVELHMRCSRIERLWKAVKPVKSLKNIDLSYSRNLIKTLDFTEVPNLEELNLQGCTKLCEVHHSIGVLKRLVSLNLKDCKTLMCLPSTTCNLKSLKILILSGCLKLTKLPERLGDMTSLEVFDAAGVGTEELPLVETGDCMHRYQLASMLPCLTTLPFLRKLNLSGCNLPEGAIPNDLTSFPLLKSLDLSGNDFLSIPSSICQLSRLTYLSISKCKRLQYLPDLPSSIEHLSLERCISLKALPNLSQLSGVTYLYFENCKSLQSLPDLPLRIEHLDMRNCTSLQTLPNLVQLSALKYLEFLNCTNLKLLPDLSSSIEHIDVENCTLLQTLPNLFEKQNLDKRFYIGFLNCSGLNGCEGKFSMALTWLKSYLLWIQEVRQLCERQKNYFQDELGRVLGVKLIKRRFQRPDFYFFLPGSKIPDWFNHKGRKHLTSWHLHDKLLE